MIMSNGGQPSNSNPWLLNAQFRNNGQLFNDKLSADASADPSGATNSRKYGLRRNLSDSIVDNLGLTDEEMATVQAELAKTDGTPATPLGKKTGLNRYLSAGMQKNLGTLAPEEQSKVDAELARMQAYAQPRQLAADTFQLGSPRNGAEPNPYQQFNPTAGSDYGTLATDAYQPQQPQPADQQSAIGYNTPALGQPPQQQMSPEQAQMLQQLLAGNSAGGVSPQGAGGGQGIGKNLGSTALTVLEKASDGASSAVKGMIFGNPDITGLQMAGTIGAGLVIANAGGFAINKLHGYDFAGGMPLTEAGHEAVKESAIGKFSRWVDGISIGPKGADGNGKAFSAGYLDNVNWMPETVKRVLGNTNALDEARTITLADGTTKTIHGDIKQYFHTFFDHMLGETEQVAGQNKFKFKNRGMVETNASIVPPRFREKFEAIITPDRLHHIKNMTYNVHDNEMMGHFTHKMLEQVSSGGWGEGYFSAKGENVNLSLANRKTLIEKLFAANESLKNNPIKTKAAFATLPDGIDVPALMTEKNGQVSEHLHHLFKSEVVEHAFELDADDTLKAIMKKPLDVVQREMAPWFSEAAIEKLKTKSYGLYCSDFMAQNPKGIAHQVPKILNDLEKGILPATNLLDNGTNWVKSLVANIPFSNEGRALFWPGGNAGQTGWEAKRTALLEELNNHTDAFHSLFRPEVHTTNVEALKKAKDFYTFQEVIRGMKTDAKQELKTAWKAGEFYDNILSRAKQMCAEDTGPRTMTAKAIEHMEVKGLGRIVPTFTHWFKNMWVGNPFEHMSGLLETAHFSNQKGKGLEKLGKAVFGSGSINNRIGRISFLLGATMAFTQAIGASFKEKNPKFTSMPSATEGQPSADKTATITALPQVPQAIGSNIASAAGIKGLGIGNNAMVANNSPQAYPAFADAAPPQPLTNQFNEAAYPVAPIGTPPSVAMPRKATESATTPEPLVAGVPVVNPAQAMATANPTQATYKPNAGDMSRAFGREFISSGLGFMVFMGVFNAINTQTQWLTKAMGRFGPQTFKLFIPFAGPWRMNWLGAAINLGGAFILMPKITDAMLKVSDKLFGKPQYVKVEEAVKKQEEAKRKAEDLAKKQEKAQAKKMGFNPAMMMPPARQG